MATNENQYQTYEQNQYQSRNRYKRSRSYFSENAQQSQIMQQVQLMINYHTNFNAYYYAYRDGLVIYYQTKYMQEAQKIDLLKKNINELQTENLKLKLGIHENAKDDTKDNTKEQFCKEIINIFPPKGYQYLESKKKDSILIEIFKNLNNIYDIVKLENHQYKFDLFRNEKFLRLYSIIPCLKEICSMIGMEKVKKKLFDHVCYFVQKLNNDNEMMHIAITGSPGVGKTELGKIIGKIYLNLGFLNNNIFKCVHRSDLVAGYLGQTAIKTQKVIDSAIGGVLFIDEAYALGSQELRDSFSKEAIDTINSNLTDNNFLCIIAGYKDDLNQCFFGYNAGLKRRFPYIYDIEDYNSEELKLIFLKKVKDNKWEINIDNSTLNSFFKHNLKEFKYFGGDMETLFQFCREEFGQRMMKESITIPSTKQIQKIDLDNAFELFKNMRTTTSELPMSVRMMYS